MKTSTEIRLGAVAGMAVLAVIWILQNGGSVETEFLFFTMDLPKPALLTITLLAGIAMGIVLTWTLSSRSKPQKG